MKLRHRVALAARPLIDRAQLPGARILIERLLRGAHGEVDVRLSTGVRMRADLSDRVQRLEAFRAYERRELALFRRALRPGAVVFDIGAHAGYYALHAAAVAAAVHAFEPLPANAARLRENVALNGFDNVIVNQAAVGATEGRARFGAIAVAGESGWGSLTVPAGADTVEMETDVVTLDAYARALNRIDLIKMDVQGAERDVLIGGAQTIARLKPDILTEAVDGCTWQYGYDVAGFLGYVRTLGYTVWSFARRGGPKLVHGGRPDGPVLYLSARGTLSP